MSTELDSQYIITEISTDGGSNYKNIVCEGQSKLSLSNSVGETKTKCGPFAAVTANSPNISGSGVASGDINPSTEMSFQQLAILAHAKTKVYIRWRNLATGTLGIGEVASIIGQGYVSDLSITAQVGDVVQFDFTLTFTGSYDTTHTS